MGSKIQQMWHLYRFLYYFHLQLKDEMNINKGIKVKPELTWTSRIVYFYFPRKSKAQDDLLLVKRYRRIWGRTKILSNTCSVLDIFWNLLLAPLCLEGWRPLLGRIVDAPLWEMWNFVLFVRSMHFYHIRLHRIVLLLIPGLNRSLDPRHEQTLSIIDDLTLGLFHTEKMFIVARSTNL